MNISEPDKKPPDIKTTYLQPTDKPSALFKITQKLAFGKRSHQCPERVVFPQGKLGGCTVISCGVTLNYTTYYLNLRNTGGNCRMAAL